MSYNLTGGSNGWASPRMFVMGALLALGHGDGIAVDLAALKGTALVPRYFGPDHWLEHHRDSLAVSWRAPGLRWLNPPYSRQCTVCPGFVWNAAKDETGCRAKGHRSRTIGDWMAKCVAESADSRSGPLIVLPPARTDGWWQQHVMGKASRVLLVGGRLRFLELAEEGLRVGANASPVPSAVIEYLPPPTPSGSWVTQFGTIRNTGHDAVVPEPIWRVA